MSYKSQGLINFPNGMEFDINWEKEIK